MIDFLKSSAKIVTEYNYVRPKILDLDHGYIKTENLRHPIVERIIEHEYVPHNIELGKDLKGMLIYGINSSGKSVLMKAIGLSIVMAQAGLYVPASLYEFSPYNSLFTRITGNDNIFRGLSSFALEMVELNAILKRTSNKTLVIGDEVCRGTEHISGSAIVATTVIELAKTNSSFIFATHLHELSNLDEIKELTNVKSFHLQVDYDNNHDTLIYDRKIKEGSGDSIYGITVARHIIHDVNFIDHAIKIKNKLLNISDTMIPNKKSKYNSKVYVYKCAECGKTDCQLDTHHICHQVDCDNGFVKDKKHIKKNQKSNLKVLCKECHQNVHNST
jgi:DNA mismatch repair protein MutS